ncbi:MAG: 2OG-Fe(II) oxygenase family protein [Pseudomonadota bacterium]
MKAWDLAITGPPGPMVIAADELAGYAHKDHARLAENLRRQARAGFSFSYLRRDITEDAAPQVCQTWARWLKTEAALEFWRSLSGIPGLTHADAQACLYRPGHFLKTHDDTYSGRRRRFAYVLNLGREWQPDWGGLLHLLEDQQVRATLVPHYNSLSVFQVPQDHCVSQVASYARSGRYSITGWLFE